MSFGSRNRAGDETHRVIIKISDQIKSLRLWYSLSGRPLSWARSRAGA